MLLLGPYHFCPLSSSSLHEIIPVVPLIFLKRSLVFPFLLFSSSSLHWSLRKAFLSLLAILWNSSFKWVYLSFSPSPLASLLFSAICKASSDKHFAFLHVAATWMDLEMIIRSEVSQTEKDKYMISLVCAMSFKNDTHKLIYQTETDSETSKTNVWLSKGKHG